ncbi:MAG: NADH-quinone oxidoreductase subunit A, partial [Nitriliruptorales bacterium]|nr:NADH-quinone oxidoreductase subunit A [Nitriliruptorales bacterium]
MMFLIFDIETVFLYPWAVVYRSMGWFGVGQMTVFFIILGVAFVYEIGRGGLTWIPASAPPERLPSSVTSSRHGGA